MKTIEEIMKDMNHGLYVYKGEVVEVLSHLLDTGDDGDEYEIYLSNGKTITGKMDNLENKLTEFIKANNTVSRVVEHRVNQCSTFNPDVMAQLRNAVLDSIRQVREDAKKVNQAKQVFQGVNTLINLAKTELDFRKYIDQQNKQYENTL